MEQEFDLSGLNVLITLPVYDGKIFVKCMAGVIEALKLLPTVNIDIMYLEGSSLIQSARNELVSGFLEKEKYNKLVFIDSDISFKGKDLVRLLALSTKYNVIAAMYPIKNKDLKFKATPRTEDGKYVYDDLGIVEMISMPLGLSVIDKEVFESIPTETYEHNGKEIKEYFRVYVNNNQLVGEDIDFCLRWKDQGGTIHCDPTIQLGHIGNYEYTGSFLDCLNIQFVGGIKYG